MIFEKACAELGVRMEGDQLPIEFRTQRFFKRLIAAARDAEAGVLQMLMEAEQKRNGANEKCLAAQQRIHYLENELRKIRWKESLESVEALTVNDRAKLLEFAEGVGNGK